MTEETLATRYTEQEMRTPTHFGTGQEAVAVGVCAALGTGDMVYTHHRSHNHFIARGGSVYELAAELYGRVDGCASGRGGSVHLTDPAKGFMVSSAILAETVATAVGTALAYAMDGEAKVAVCFFGEGTLDEGAFYEAINFAAIRKLPVIFACENNLYATESPLSVRQAEGSDLCDRLRAFKVTSERVDGNDVVAVYDAAARAVEQARSGGGPVFLECMTYRWREHVGPMFDHDAKRTYRDKAELDAWIAKDPVWRSAARLVEQGIAKADEVEAWAAETKAEIEATVERARHAPWPSPDTLFENA
ncbi:thiamine pyrophosphate-dependent dehydrogenase E1 component subunit alpha [Tardiphaga sp. 367_B4_N1_1]|uniref:thiamine pyrophosphate-dependent dehydrogenase E1 component subunit alpha n=1 Tax=Tardiphaga sp. 367_B4_N1_1 TaxID=3240777 RepID=UPI003F27D1F6